MTSPLSQDELVVSRSRTRVLRAGYANAILLLAAIGLFLANQALLEGGANALARAVVLIGLGLGVLKVYSWSLSRLYIEQGRTLVLVGPLSRSAIELSDIVGYEVGGIPASQFVSVKIRVRSSRWPRYRFFVAVFTNLGPYSETRARLQELLRTVVRPE